MKGPIESPKLEIILRGQSLHIPLSHSRRSSRRTKAAHESREIINAGTLSNSMRIRNLQLFVDRIINIEEPNEVGAPNI